MGSRVVLSCMGAACVTFRLCVWAIGVRVWRPWVHVRIVKIWTRISNNSS